MVFFSFKNRSHSYCLLSVSILLFFFSFRFSSSCFAFNMCFNRHIARARAHNPYTGKVIGEWKLQMTNELIHGWFVTFFGIVDSNVIKYIRGVRFQHWRESSWKTERPHREWRRWRWANIFICFIVIIHTLRRCRRAQESERETFDFWQIFMVPYLAIFNVID